MIGYLGLLKSFFGFLVGSLTFLALVSFAFFHWSCYNIISNATCQYKRHCCISAIIYELSICWTICRELMWGTVFMSSHSEWKLSLKSMNLGIHLLENCWLEEQILWAHRLIFCGTKNIFCLQHRFNSSFKREYISIALSIKCGGGQTADEINKTKLWVHF